MAYLSNLAKFLIASILLLRTQRSSCARAFLILAGNLIHWPSILACYLMHVVLCHAENLMGKQLMECDCEVALVAATRVSKSRWNCDWTGNICKKRQSFNYTVVAAIFLTATIISGSCLSNPNWKMFHPLCHIVYVCPGLISLLQL